MSSALLLWENRQIHNESGTQMVFINRFAGEMWIGPCFGMMRLGHCRIKQMKEQTANDCWSCFKMLVARQSQVLCIARSDLQMQSLLWYVCCNVCSEGRQWGVGSVVVGSAILGHPDLQSRGQKSGVAQTQSQRQRTPRSRPSDQYVMNTKSVKDGIHRSTSWIWI